MWRTRDERKVVVCKQCGYRDERRVESVEPLGPCPRCQWVEGDVVLLAQYKIAKKRKEKL